MAAQLAIPFTLYLRFVGGNLLEQFQSAGVDFALGDGGQQGAAGFVLMVAIAETALSQIIGKLDKTLFDFAQG